MRIRNYVVTYQITKIVVAVAQWLRASNISTHGAGSSPAGSVGRDLNLQKLDNDVQA